MGEVDCAPAPLRRSPSTNPAPAFMLQRSNDFPEFGLPPGGRSGQRAEGHS